MVKRAANFIIWYPVQYSLGITEEHRITRSEAGLFYVFHMGQLSIDGSADYDKFIKENPN